MMEQTALSAALIVVVVAGSLIAGCLGFLAGLFVRPSRSARDPLAAITAHDRYPAWKVVGYQPTDAGLNTDNPPKGGSGVPTAPKTCCNCGGGGCAEPDKGAEPPNCAATTEDALPECVRSRLLDLGKSF